MRVLIVIYANLEDMLLEQHEHGFAPAFPSLSELSSVNNENGFGEINPHCSSSEVFQKDGQIVKLTSFDEKQACHANTEKQRKLTGNILKTS